MPIKFRSSMFILRKKISIPDISNFPATGISFSLSSSLLEKHRRVRFNKIQGLITLHCTFYANVKTVRPN